MCTVNDEDGDLLMISKKPFPLSEKMCRSCDNAAKVVLRKKDAYCRSCFLNSSVHKFRATLGKSKMLKGGDKVAVLFTGSSSSIALLHLLYCGLNEETSKRLVFNVDCLFIDDGLVSGASLEKRQETVEEAKILAKSFNFEIFVTTLSEVLSESPRVNTILDVRENLEDKMKEIIENVKSITAKEDLLYQLKHKLMLKIACIKGYDKVFTPEIGSELAVKLLVGIAIGRGDQMSVEVGFCDSTTSGIAILRPLKDFTQKEIIYYIIFQGIEPMTMLSQRKIHSQDVSIQKTTENFVNDLQEKFPSTVYTIFRTGDKLKMCDSDVNKDHRNCMLCQKVMKDKYDKICDAIDALDFSRKVSVLGDKSAVCCSGYNCANQNESFNGRRMEEFLCYGCNLILKDMEKGDIFWRHLLKEEIHVRNVQNLKNQVSEYLIE